MIGYLWDSGVYSYLGPTWDEDVDKVCGSVGFWNCRVFRSNYFSTRQPFSSRIYDHWMQISQARRFQEFVEDWDYPNNYEAPLYPMEDISIIPVSMIIASDDPVCPAERAYELADRISTMANVVTLKG